MPSPDNNLMIGRVTFPIRSHKANHLIHDEMVHSTPKLNIEITSWRPRPSGSANLLWVQNTLSVLVPRGFHVSTDVESCDSWRWEINFDPPKKQFQRVRHIKRALRVMVLVVVFVCRRSKLWLVGGFSPYPSEK